jgi:hypothetical protein
MKHRQGVLVEIGRPVSSVQRFLNNQISVLIIVKGMIFIAEALFFGGVRAIRSTPCPSKKPTKGCHYYRYRVR